MRWALLGCGVIGRRRAENLPDGVRLKSCFDPEQTKSQALAKDFGIQSVSSHQEIISDPELSAVLICTINAALAKLAQEALNAGKHVLVEKPAARSFAELQNLKVPPNLIFKVGFNHRFHPAFRELQAELAANPNDPIMYIRASYGNGARVGFDREWRAKPELSGGGELLDQGVHVLDLALQLLGELKVSSSLVRTHYWDMPVDDNAWALCTTPSNQSFSMHVSSSEWKNEFRFEVYTRTRKYLWQGLGRSYGAETLSIYKMKPEMGPPELDLRKYSEKDNSWLFENANFLAACRGQEKPDGDFNDAQKVLKLVSDIYRSSPAPFLTNS